MEKTFCLEIDGVVYPLIVKKKAGVRKFLLRYKKQEKSFYLTCPYFTSSSSALEMAKRNALPLLNKVESFPSYYQDGYLYLLGERHYVGAMGEEDLKRYLKKMALPLFEERVAYYEKTMRVKPPYKVKARSMSTRYGVNSKRTHSITLQSELICYALPIIDSVVVHELAHHFEFNHGEKFYKIVYAYCPDYKSLHACLKKGNYDGKTHLKK